MTERTERLLTLADRCEREGPSRELDGEIYCAIHNLVDLNGRHTQELRKAHTNGEVMVAYHEGVIMGWFTAPLYTCNMKAAQTLFDEHPNRSPDEPMLICSLALRMMATT